MDITQFVVALGNSLTQIIGFIIDTALFGLGAGLYGLVNGLIGTWFAL